LRGQHLTFKLILDSYGRDTSIGMTGPGILSPIATGSIAPASCRVLSLGIALSFDDILVSEKS